MAMTTFLFPISIVLLVASGFLGYLNLKEPTYYEKNPLSGQNRLQAFDTNTSVLTTDGKLQNAGWTNTPENLHLDTSRINPSTSYFKFFNPYRYKKWEFFMFTHKDFSLAVATFDLGYIGGYIIHLSNYTQTNNRIYCEEFLNPVNKPVIANNCLVNCQSALYNVSINNAEKFYFDQQKTSKLNNQFLKINFDNKNLKRDFNLSFDIDIKAHKQRADSIVTLTPISADSTLFYYNTKTYSLQANGKIIINGIKYDQKDVLVSYDSGKGVWPIRSGWIWISANGKFDNSAKIKRTEIVEDKGEQEDPVTGIHQHKDVKEESANSQVNVQGLIGLNFGHGFSHKNATNHTEDSFFINGVIYKLPVMDTKQVSEDKWTIVNNENYRDRNVYNYCNIEFVILKRADMTKNFVVASIVFKLSTGNFSGYCQDTNGNEFSFRDVKGLIENKLSVW